MYGKTLQFSEWLETTKQHDLTEQDHAARLDLIAKVHGIQKAEKYIEKIPKSFKGRSKPSSCVTDLSATEEETNIKVMSRERPKRGTLPLAQENIEKLQKVVEEGNYYGAQQMYKSISARYVSAQRYSEALDILQSGACIQLKHGQGTLDHLVMGLQITGPNHGI
nr:pentatricopeptide repeat-containing protein, mitochondrial [Quercus suber]